MPTLLNQPESRVDDAGSGWQKAPMLISLLVVAALFCIYVLGKHKREFKWP